MAWDASPPETDTARLCCYSSAYTWQMPRPLPPGSSPLKYNPKKRNEPDPRCTPSVCFRLRRGLHCCALTNRFCQLYSRENRKFAQRSHPGLVYGNPWPIQHYSRRPLTEYPYLPTGYYDFTYDINTEVLSFTRKGRVCRVGEYSGDKTKTYEYYKAPYDDVPYPGLTASAYGNTFKTTGGFVLYAETDNWAWYRSWNNHAQENNY